MQIINFEISKYGLIENFNIRMEQSNLVGIIGHSGSGKTLLLEVFSFLFFGNKTNLRKFEGDIRVKAVVDLPGEEEYTVIERTKINNKTAVYINDQFSSQAKVDELIKDQVSVTHQNSSFTIIDDLNRLINQKFALINDQYAQICMQYKINYQKLNELQKDLKEKENFTPLTNYEITEYEQTIKNIDQFLISDQKLEELVEIQKNDMKLVKSLELIQNNYKLLTNSTIIEQIQYLVANYKPFNDEDQDFITNLQNFKQTLELKVDELTDLTNSSVDLNQFDENEQIIFINQQLRQKYQTYAEIINEKAKIEETLEIHQNYHQIISKLSQKIEKQTSLLSKIAKQKAKMELTFMNQKLSQINEDLKEIKFSYDLEFSLQESEFSKYGGFKIMINSPQNTNLINSLSGGEKARLSLVLNYYLNNKNTIFLWDEVDTGLSGEIGFKVGKLIKKLSLENQIIMISHLPQVAVFASQIINPEKIDQKITYNILNNEKIIEIITSLLAGEKSSVNTINNAKDLYNQAHGKK